MSMQRYPVVAVVGPRNCQDAMLRTMSDLELQGFLTLGCHIWDTQETKTRWKILSNGKGVYKLNERLTDSLRQRIKRADRVVVVDVDGVDDPLYTRAVKAGFSAKIPVERWTYKVIGNDNNGNPIHRKVETKLIEHLPEAFFD